VPKTRSASSCTFANHAKGAIDQSTGIAVARLAGNVQRPDGRTADRGVPHRDREREETSTRLRNGQARLGDLRCRQGGMGR
jgi:hypothetical protein